MAQIAEYRNVQMAKSAVIQTTEYVNDYGRSVKLELVHRPAGWQCAGSMARYQDHDVWSVGNRSTGAWCGRSFATETEAKAWFAKITGFRFDSDGEPASCVLAE